MTLVEFSHQADILVRMYDDILSKDNETHMLAAVAACLDTVSRIVDNARYSAGSFTDRENEILDVAYHRVEATKRLFIECLQGRGREEDKP